MYYILIRSLALLLLLPNTTLISHSKTYTTDNPIFISLNSSIGKLAMREAICIHIGQV